MRLERKAGIIPYLLSFLLLCSPYLPALLLQGIWDGILFLALGSLLLIVSAFKEELSAALSLCVRAIAFLWNVAPSAPIWLALSFARVQLPQFPSLSPLFQRPPPLFV